MRWFVLFFVIDFLLEDGRSVRRKRERQTVEGSASIWIGLNQERSVCCPLLMEGERLGIAGRNVLVRHQLGKQRMAGRGGVRGTGSDHGGGRGGGGRRQRVKDESQGDRDTRKQGSFTHGEQRRTGGNC